MSNVWGENIKCSIFGESHGKAIGIVIGGLPAGEPVDEDEIFREMQRRAPGNSALSTPRKESDVIEIVSGIFNGKTTGAPLCAFIKNENAHSGEYDATRPRPGHADLSAYIKYKGFNDYRGGGHFSGRLTAPLVFAGSVAKQILAQRGIVIGAHIKQIGNLQDKTFTDINETLLKELTNQSFPLLNKEIKESMETLILKAKEDNNSVGGIVECAACGIPAGLGEPFFGSMESVISQMMFSIPAVKGVSFGSGFDMAEMRGSEANDAIRIENNKIITATNHNGGINGGITNGMPIVCSVAFKPTPSIAKQQDTVNLNTMCNDTVTVKGRHDPCIVPRAVAVVEGALALCILDQWEAKRQ